MATHVFAVGASPPSAKERSLDIATAALEECETTCYDVEAGLGDAEDSLMALEDPTSSVHLTRLSEVLIAGQELARHTVKQVGGAYLPDLAFDPEVYAPRALATSLLAVCLASVAARLQRRGASSGIEIAAHNNGSTVEVTLATAELPPEEFEGIADELGAQLVYEYTVSLRGSAGALRLSFRVVAASH